MGRAANTFLESPSTIVGVDRNSADEATVPKSTAESIVCPNELLAIRPINLMLSTAE